MRAAEILVPAVIAITAGSAWLVRVLSARRRVRSMCWCEQNGRTAGEIETCRAERVCPKAWS